VIKISLTASDADRTFEIPKSDELCFSTFYQMNQLNSLYRGLSLPAAVNVHGNRTGASRCMPLTEQVK